MNRLFDGFEERPAADLVLTAGVAHLWFVTIHQFDDGNGRIARAVADLMLARSEESAQRFYSMSAQIHRERRQRSHPERGPRYHALTGMVSGVPRPGLRGAESILATVM